MNIKITPAAETFMRRMIRFQGNGQESGFRLSVSTGGCSGLASQFTIESAPSPDDITLPVNGVNLFLPPQSCELLEGATIDFSDSPLQSGLTFSAPAGIAGACSGASNPSPSTVSISVANIARRRPAAYSDS